MPSRSSLEAVPVEAAIKWPNDVLVDGRKLAGILVEGRPQEGWVVLGIGLNVSAPAGGFPEQIRDIAAALPAGAARADVLAALIVRLETRLASPLAAGATTTSSIAPLPM